MKLSLLFFIILIILFTFTARGHRLGILGILFGAISWIFVIAVMILAGPFISRMLFPGVDSFPENFLAKGGGTFIAFIAAIIAVCVIRFLIRHSLRSKGIISGLLKFTGTLWGLLEGLMICWVILMFCGILLKGETEPELLSDIQENIVLKTLYENNPIGRLF